MNITKMLMLMGVVMGVSTGCLRADCGGCGDNKGGAKCGEERGKGKRGGSSKCDTKGKKRGGRGNMMKELGLSDEQKEQMKAIGKKNQESMKNLMTKMHESRKKMRDASMNENVDEAAIRALSKEVADTIAELTIQKSKMHKEMQAIMTDEQKAKAKELRAKMQKEMKNRKQCGKSGKGGKGGFSQQMNKRRECK